MGKDSNEFTPTMPPELGDDDEEDDDDDDDAAPPPSIVLVEYISPPSSSAAATRPNSLRKARSISVIRGTKTNRKSLVCDEDEDSADVCCCCWWWLCFCPSNDEGSNRTRDEAGL